MILISSSYSASCHIPGSSLWTQRGTSRGVMDPVVIMLVCRSGTILEQKAYDLLFKVKTTVLGA